MWFSRRDSWNISNHIKNGIEVFKSALNGNKKLMMCRQGCQQPYSWLIEIVVNCPWLGYRLEPANTDYRHHLCGKFNSNLNFGELFFGSRIRYRWEKLMLSAWCPVLQCLRSSMDNRENVIDCITFTWAGTFAYWNKLVKIRRLFFAHHVVSDRIIVANLPSIECNCHHFFSLHFSVTSLFLKWEPIVEATYN